MNFLVNSPNELSYLEADLDSPFERPLPPDFRVRFLPLADPPFDPGAPLRFPDPY